VLVAPGFGSAASVNSGNINLILPPPEERERSQDDIANALQRAVRRLPGARVNVSQPATIATSSGRGAPVQFILQGPDLEALRAAIPPFMERAQQDPAFQFVRVDLEFTLPELQVEVDRTRAQALGIDPLDVAQTLQLALSEQRLGYFVRAGEQYEVLAQVEREARNTPGGLRSLFVRSASGTPIPLENLIATREAAAPPQLFRYNRFTAATVSAQPAEGVPLGAALDAMDRIAEEALPPGFTTALAGQSRDFRESSGQAYVAFLLALVLIYLVLAAQFESFRDPFIILLTVPLALAGALLFLWYFDATLNVFSQIGLVMLVGLVTKNGILIVEFARQRREAGLGVREAVEEAAAARFRPILMTTLATILGTLPIALALGAGAESRIPMGLAVIGGLSVGTLLTLFVIPALYTFLAGRHEAAAHDAELDAALAEAERTNGRPVLSGDGAPDGAPQTAPAGATERRDG